MLDLTKVNQKLQNQSPLTIRSEERRVGKEDRSWWSTSHGKKKALL